MLPFSSCTNSIVRVTPAPTAPKPTAAPAPAPAPKPPTPTPTPAPAPVPKPPTAGKIPGGAILGAAVVAGGALLGGKEALAANISKYESGKEGYNAYNKGTVGNRMIPSDKPIDFSKMTISEYLRRGNLKKDDPDRLFAVGKYQIIPDTMRDLVKKLKDKVLAIGSPSGWGEWITDKDDEWFYDDGEGGYDTELEFDYKDPANIVVRSGEDEETIPLNNEDDIEKIIKHAERISGLKAEPEEEDESPGEPSAGPLSESVKRRFARLANIKHKK